MFEYTVAGVVDPEIIVVNIRKALQQFPVALLLLVVYLQELYVRCIM
jgi:hypothetical protein